MVYFLEPIIIHAHVHPTHESNRITLPNPKHRNTVHSNILHVTSIVTQPNQRTTNMGISNPTQPNVQRYNLINFIVAVTKSLQPKEFHF